MKVNLMLVLIILAAMFCQYHNPSIIDRAVCVFTYLACAYALYVWNK